MILVPFASDNVVSTLILCVFSKISSLPLFSNVSSCSEAALRRQAHLPLKHYLVNEYCVSEFQTPALSNNSRRKNMGH